MRTNTMRRDQALALHHSRHIRSLNIIQPFQQPERVVGFFNTYRQLHPVSCNVLPGIADRFQDSLKTRAQRRANPIVEAPRGARGKFVDRYFNRRAGLDEVAVMLKARESAHGMTVTARGLCKSS